MKLSVCVFTYNHAAYISQTIESILMQKSDFDFEIVIGEDNSTDGTREIVQEYQLKYPGKVRAILNPENKGMMKNNIDTILACRGEYIALMDGDDFWTNPQKVQKQVDFLNANSSYAFCFHDGLILGVDGKIADVTCCYDLKKNTVEFDDVISDVSIPTHSIVFRRAAIGGYPPKWFETLNAPDLPLYLLLCEYGSGYFFSECWGVYRKHAGGSWTGQHYQSRWLTYLQIYRVMNEHFDYKYDRYFKRSESKICFALAVDLAEDKKLKRAVCYFRRSLIAGSSKQLPDTSIFIKLFNFIYFFSKYQFTNKSQQIPAGV